MVQSTQDAPAVANFSIQLSTAPSLRPIPQDHGTWARKLYNLPLGSLPYSGEYSLKELGILSITSKDGKYLPSLPTITRIVSLLYGAQEASKHGDMITAKRQIEAAQRLANHEAASVILNDQVTQRILNAPSATGSANTQVNANNSDGYAAANPAQAPQAQAAGSSLFRTKVCIQGESAEDCVDNNIKDELGVRIPTITNARDIAIMTAFVKSKNPDAAHSREIKFPSNAEILQDLLAKARPASPTTK